MANIQDSEKQILKDIITILFSTDFSKNKLTEKNIIINSEEDFQISENINKAIILDLGDNKSKFLANCKSLYPSNKTRKSKLNYKYFVLGVVIVLIVSMFLILFNDQRNIDNSELLEKYTFIRDESLGDFYNEELKIANINKKETVNLFEDSYIQFENPYFGYSLARGMSKKMEMLLI